jgi:hypothetical protein
MGPFQYRKLKLIERYGADIRLPDLREEIAQCERLGLMHDACMARYFVPPSKRVTELMSGGLVIEPSTMDALPATRC